MCHDIQPFRYMLLICHQFRQVNKIYQITVFLHNIPFRLYLEYLKRLFPEYSRTHIPEIFRLDQNANSYFFCHVLYKKMYHCSTRSKIFHIFQLNFRRRIWNYSSNNVINSLFSLFLTSFTSLITVLRLITSRKFLFFTAQEKKFFLFLSSAILPVAESGGHMSFIDSVTAFVLLHL